MLTISKNIFILLSLTALHPSNTFGENVHKDLSTELLFEVMQTLPNEIKSIKDDIKDINLKIDRLGGGSLKDKLLKIVLQESGLLEPNMEVDTEIYNKSSVDISSPTPYRSSFDSVNILQGMQEQITNIRNLLNKAPNYDESFNCIKNCSSSGILPQSCSAATSANSFKDGVYLLQGPKSDSKPFYVYCDHENYKEKSWMIIQRREDGSVDFNRNWLDYKLGFGDLNGDYWIGLERLHQITSNRPHELWISLWDFEGEHRYAKYSEFIVGSEDEGYKLTSSGYSGDAGDSLEYQSSMKFSTFEKDNDEDESRNCAKEFNAGWWYKDCYKCNLNGIYKSSAKKKEKRGIIWGGWHGQLISLKYVRMGIRPKEA